MSQNTGYDQQATVEAIAKNILNLHTLDERGSDRLDFSDQYVTTLAQALRAAYDSGYNDGLGANLPE